MAGKFIELKEAAQQLGISPERLLEMRESGQVHGYRDGPSWKFKIEEIERVAAEAADLGADSAQLSDSAPLSQDDIEGLLDVPAESDSEEGLDGSSILINEEAKDRPDGGSSSTVIGKEKDKEGKGEEADSDLKLSDEPPDSDVSLVPEEGGDSDVKVVAGDSDLKLADEEDLSDEMDLDVDNELDFDSDDALMLGEDSELKLADSGEAALDDSGEESDSSVPVTEESSGALASPSDSGLSLESAPDDLSSGALELPEDEEMVSLDDEIMASPDDETQLQQDEEFLLSPSGEMLGDESSDSGSQVIALEESDSFAEEAVAAPDSGEAILEEEGEGLETQLETFEGATAVEAGVVPLGAAELPEADYSIWNILSLLLIVALLAVTGMLMTDVVRNMWAFSGESNVTSGVADALVSLLGMN